MSQTTNNAHSAYFDALNDTLKKEGLGTPHLLIDLDRVDQNIEQLQHNWPEHCATRLVVKSLPSLDLLQYLIDQLNTKKLMVFHLPFLCQVVTAFADSDVLIGKPFPCNAAEQFYRYLAIEASSFSAETQLQWLIDTPERLNQYLTLAKKLGIPMTVNIELDIGLHRGGVDHLTTLDVMLTTIRNHPKWLTLGGFMGYDAHVTKLPKWLCQEQQAYDLSQQRYQKYLDYTERYFNELMAHGLTINGAGSPTIEHHKQSSVCNDLSIGSLFLKPSDFDSQALMNYQPSAFIASPILKRIAGFKLPGPEWLGRLLSRLDSRYQTSYFIYGGYWKAILVNQKLRTNPWFGRSSNQDMVNGPLSLKLAVDDHIFWRPTQSESVLLKFGDLLAVRGKNIEGRWPVLNQHL